MVYTSLIISIVVAVLAVAVGGAYASGALDPLIQQLGVLFFKAKAEAEVKKLQAQGLQEGQDFVKGMFALILHMHVRCIPNTPQSIFLDIQDLNANLIFLS
jgi:uncharacterized protein YdgA (DUF945 family)